MPGRSDCCGQRRWLPALSAPLLLGILVGLRLWQFDNDDPYITYRYARNLATGNSLVYNPGERVLGTTSPLFALILGGLTLLGRDPAFWGKLVSCLSLGVVGVLVGRLVGGASRREHRSLAWLVAGALAVLDPLLITGGFGSETFLHVSLIFGAFLLLDSPKQVIAGVLLGCAIVCRGDAVVAAAVYLAVWTVRNRRLPVHAVIGLGTLAGAWGMFAWAYYGTPIPQTLAIKRLQAHVWGSDFLEGIAFYAMRYFGESRWVMVIAPLAAIGLLRIIRLRLTVCGALVVWALCYLGAYAILNVPHVYIWYYSVVSPVLVMLACLGTADLAGRRRPVGALLAGAGVVTAFVAFIQCEQAFHRWLPYPRHPVYVEAAQWIEAHSPQEATIAAFEVGAVGYASEHRIIDLWGLVTPDVGHHTMALGDGTYALRRFRPDYLIVHRELWGNERLLLEAPWFDEAYRFEMSFSSPRYSGVDVFRLVDPAAVPGV
ncbi:MAG: glycosyltransferase 87 family protein [Candidatus Eisenbacteria bacterium]|nr:glycosyltransferase 87 family protein [Candidatus Eisenbacteria bacterium]